MATGHEPRVSVIIPNWNGSGLLRSCLASLSAQEYADFEIVVVDNASQDDSVAMVRGEFPHVRLLASDTNLGYSAGCNAGIRMARGEILVMLNNDTECDPAWLGSLVSALDRHAEAGMAASRLMIYDQPHVIHSAGDLYRRDGTADSRGVWQVYGPPYDQERWVFGGCGGALAIRRTVLDEIGTFEESFFMYLEDVDLSWRAQLAGWRCVYAPEAVVYHHLSATGGGRLASYYVARNRLWVIARHYPGALFRGNWRRILVSQCCIAKEALRSWRGAAARATLRGQLVGLLTCVRWLPARWMHGRARRVPLSYISSMLD